MSAACLYQIPGITVDEPVNGVLIITAPDGFRLRVMRSDRKTASGKSVIHWSFGPLDTSFRPAHFHLRQLIDAALNPKKVTQ